MLDIKIKKKSDIAKYHIRSHYCIVMSGVLHMAPFLFLLLISLADAGGEDFAIEVVADGLKVPWSLDFAPDGRIFFSERGGSVYTIENGRVSEPLISRDVGSVEGGMLGIALDPDFEDNGYVYAYYTYTDWWSTYNRVVRFTQDDGMLVNETVLIDGIPGGLVHNGGRIKFADDNTLYITTGDAGNAALAQDMNSLAGKILRINSDGTVPSDNPFADSAVYSLGHRNPQGLDWEPDTGVLLISEHGPSGEKGFAHDEINSVYPGTNYGWPDIVGDQTKQGMNAPLLHSGTVTWAPSGAVFYDHDLIEEFAGKFLVATLAGNHMMAVQLDLEQNMTLGMEKYFEAWGRLRDVAVDESGNLYILTSNQDGRGYPAHDDDRIVKISPYHEPFLAPLKQVQEGTKPLDVRCNSGLILVLKEHDAMPACVKTGSLEELFRRGWAAQPSGM